MCQLSVFGEETLSSESWPASGTTVDGILYPLLTWERITDESDFGYWRTPDANMERGSRTKENLKDRIERGMPLNLNDQLNGIQKGLLEEPKRWPTPDCSDRRGPGSKQQGLSNLVKKFPTPAARDWKDGNDPKPHGRHSESLPVVVNQMDGGALNPTWVEWLMGYPEGWTDLEPWVMQWFRSKRGKRLKDSSE